VRRLEVLAAERRDAEARGARAVEEAQARFREELTRRDALRAQELARLQAALQERARREKALEMELARHRGPARNLAGPVAPATPAADAPARVSAAPAPAKKEPT
jgi:ParB family transcriptional regulator, chromosome partitioning protein